MSSWPLFSTEESKKVSKILLSNKVNYFTGTEGRCFEKEFSEFAHVKYSIALSNGTAALEIALRAIGIKNGDEVIVTPRSFIASVSSVIVIGGTPVFSDIDYNSGNINVNEIKKVTTKKTKAIICVHIAGYPCDMKEIMKFAKKRNIRVIEDCSQGHGAKINNKSVGSFGDIGTWSFCQDKIITTGGEGGMVTTNSKKLWNLMWSYKDHGKNYHSVFKKKHPPGHKWIHDTFGSNMRMTEMQAGIGRIQLNRIEEWNRKRNKNASMIINACSKFDKILITPKIPSNFTHAWYRCNITLNIKSLKNNWNRNKIINEFANLGTIVFSGSCSEIYLEKAFSKKPYKPKKRLKNAKLLGENTLSFLVHPTINRKEILKIVSDIDTVFTKVLS